MFKFTIHSLVILCHIIRCQQQLNNDKHESQVNLGWSCEFFTFTLVYPGIIFPPAQSPSLKELHLFDLLSY